MENKYIKDKYEVFFEKDYIIVKTILVEIYSTQNIYISLLFNKK